MLFFALATKSGYKSWNVEKVDMPQARTRRNPAVEIKAKKRYVRKLAKEFGWKIVRLPR
jgi:hypothetical protein